MKLVNLEKRFNRSKIFNKNAKMPETKEECIDYFMQLLAELSPENLCCDGELSRSEVIKKEKEIVKTWRELEYIYGEEMSMEKAEEIQMKRIKDEFALKKN